MVAARSIPTAARPAAPGGGCCRALFAIGTVLLLAPLLLGTQRSPTPCHAFNIFEPVDVVGSGYDPVLYHTIEWANISTALNEELRSFGTHRVVVIGGVDYERSIENFTLSGVQIYSLGLWRKCATPDNATERRFAYHASLVHNNDQEVFIFGGVELDARGDFHVISRTYKLTILPDLRRREFFCHYTPIDDDADIKPPPRFAHAMVRYDEDTAFLYGGCANAVPGIQRTLFQSYIECTGQHGDLWRFDFRTYTWTAFPVQGIPTLSFHHLGVFQLSPTTQFLYTFAGYMNSSIEYTRNKDMFVLSLPSDSAADAAAVTVTAMPIANYTSITIRNRGTTDRYHKDALLYLVTPVVTDAFADNLKVVFLRGTFHGDDLTSLRFEWQPLNLISSFHVPGSSIESLNAFPLGGGFAFGRSVDSFGVLIGVLINVAFGDRTPAWEINFVDQSTVAANTIVPNAHISARVTGTVTQVGPAQYFVSGGIATKARTSSFLLDIDDRGDGTENEALIDDFNHNNDPLDRELDTAARDLENQFLSKSVAALRVTPNIPAEHVARAGHCAINLEDGRVLLAGGVDDFSTRTSVADAYFSVADSQFTWAEDATASSENTAYENLRISGHHCFKRGPFVFSIGGEVSILPGAPAPTPQEADQVCPLLRPSAPVFIWSPSTGWSPCRVAGFDETLTYGVASFLETSPTGPLHDPIEEVVWFGGEQLDRTGSCLTHPSNLLFALSCEGKPWEECTCEDLLFRKFDPPAAPVTEPPQATNSILEEWPEARVSMCANRIGSRRMIMDGGHRNSVPASFTYLLEFDSSGLPRWVTVRDFHNVPAQHPTTPIGPLCFSHKRNLYSIGGAGEGSLIPGIEGIQVTCNFGYGIPKGFSFFNSSCVPCSSSEYRGSFNDDMCAACPPGVTRVSDPNTLGINLRDCRECDPSYCLNGGSCFINAALTAQCQCPYWYHGLRCENFDTDELLQAIFIPIALFALAGVALCGKRFLHRAKENADLQKRLLSDHTAELYELHSAWEVNPNDLEFIKFLSRGGFGDVWLAKWLVKDELVAVKKLLISESIGLDLATANNQDLNDNDEWSDWVDCSTILSAFSQEIAFMKSIKHRNIVYFHGACLQSSNSFIVMEYLERGSLADVIEDMSIHISRDRRVQFMQDAASGMNYLHNLSPPRIHRDLKSFNLLVNENWVVKVADFTTAKKLLEGPEAVSKSSQPKSQRPRESTTSAADLRIMDTTTEGTLPWSAPEVLSQQAYSLSVDVYSFGVVMWELLARKHPFEDIQYSSQIEAIVLQGGRPDVTDEMRQADPSYVQLMSHCWDQDPEARPTFAEVERELVKVKNTSLA